MIPVVITPPAVEPVTLAEAKLHARIEFADDDALVSTLITSARQSVETRTDRALISTTYEWTLDGWPLSALTAGGRYFQSLNMPPAPLAEIRIGRAPLVSVASIRYYDPAGVLQTLDPTLYQVMAGTPGRIMPALGKAWPALQSWPGAVVVRYTVGYGPTAADVPECAKLAMKYMITSWYAYREWATDVGNNFGLVPETVDALIAPLLWGSYC